MENYIPYKRVTSVVMAVTFQAGKAKVTFAVVGNSTQKWTTFNAVMDGAFAHKHSRTWNVERKSFINNYKIII